MRLALFGGFGEKGRTSLGIEAGGTRLIIDAGINTSASGRAYYPAITPDELAASDALLITHAHEDHVGAVGWCLANGFSGRILMTAPTMADARAIWAGYAEPGHRQLAEQAKLEPLAGSGEIAIGGLRIRTGRSGHVAGGVWIWVDDGSRVLGYCGDCVPDSGVFVMDPPPPCDVLVLDASYGDDAVPPAARAAAVRDWVRCHPACILPTPLQGRSLELLAILDAPIAVHASMRTPMASQIADERWLRPRVSERLRAKLADARDWHEGEPFPECPLLCHDGMGLSGPSRAILARARGEGAAVLFTGHLPANSPGQRMLEEGCAHWLRLPTHPTLEENRCMIDSCGPQVVLGHSAEPAAMQRLAQRLPLIRARTRTGERLELARDGGLVCASS
jgi:Cft2 family RNA processing exonuclease